MGKQDIRFVCTAAAEQLGLLKTGETARYRYLGCFQENTPNRQLETQLWGNGYAGAENGNCITACAQARKNFKYAATQYQGECWCGNKLPRVQATEDQCGYVCNGNDTQICGGDGLFHIEGAFMSLFGDSERQDNDSSSTTISTPDTPTPTPTPIPTPVNTPVHNTGNGLFRFMGCFNEPVGGRALLQLTGDDELTVSRCLDMCSAYPYAGMEYARECWCGSVLGDGAKNGSLADCNMPCAGNASEYCGAGNRLELFMKNLNSSTHTLLSSTSAAVPTDQNSSPSLASSTGLNMTQSLQLPITTTSNVASISVVTYTSDLGFTENTKRDYSSSRYAYASQKSIEAELTFYEQYCKHGYNPRPRRRRRSTPPPALSRQTRVTRAWHIVFKNYLLGNGGLGA